MTAKIEFTGHLEGWTLREYKEIAMSEEQKLAAPPPANDELRGMAEEFTPILKDIALEIIGAKSVVSSNLSDAKPENVLTRRVLPLLAQVAARARADMLRAPIGDLIVYHEKEAKNHISSQWIYSNHMFAVGAYKKVLRMIDELERGAELQKAVEK